MKVASRHRLGGRSRWCRMRSMTSGCVMTLRIRNEFPHHGHCVTSTAKARSSQKPSASMRSWAALTRFLDFGSWLPREGLIRQSAQREPVTKRRNGAAAQLRAHGPGQPRKPPPRRAQQQSWARRFGPWTVQAPSGKRQPKRPRSRHSAPARFPLSTPSRGRNSSPPGLPCCGSSRPCVTAMASTNTNACGPANHHARSPHGPAPITCREPLEASCAPFAEPRVKTRGIELLYITVPCRACLALYRRLAKAAAGDGWQRRSPVLLLP